MSTTGIPAIARTLKIRKKASFSKDSVTSSESDNLTIQFSLPVTPLTKESEFSFSKARKSWVSKNS